MCGRLALPEDYKEIVRKFGVREFVDNFGPRYNVAPTTKVPAVVEREGQRELELFRWGLIPVWAKDRTVGNKTFNARSETVASSGMFRDSFKTRRCVIPAQGFYEWQAREKGKVPHFVVRQDGEPLNLAGLWSTWKNPEDGEQLLSCTVITTQPNELMAQLHNRMPVILDDEDLDEWLDPTQRDPVRLQGLLVPCPAEELKTYPVSNLVNKVGNDGPELIAPAEDEDKPAAK
jgi:putative SOS response-associated peptidase YedK